MEALVGLLLFSAMLALYVPALSQEWQRLEQARRQIQYWQVFYNLSKLYSHEQSLDKSDAQLIKQLFERNANCQIQSISLESDFYQITFQGGQHYEVILEDWELSP